MSNNKSFENPAPNENNWLERLLNRFQKNPHEIVNSDEWLRSLLEKPVEEMDSDFTQVSRHVPGVQPMLNRTPDNNSQSPEMSQIIDDLVHWIDEANNVSLDYRDNILKFENKVLSVSGDEDVSEAINNIRHHLYKWENEFNRQKYIQKEDSEYDTEHHNTTTVESWSWMDAVLRLNSHLNPNDSTSSDWLATLLSKPYSTPTKIPKMDFSQTSALPLRKSSN